MTRYLALDWERSLLCGIEADIGKHGFDVSQGFQLEIPEGHTSSGKLSPVELGSWLRGELDRLGVSATKVLVSLPREEIAIRQLQLPDVPESELPDMVRYQVAGTAGVSPDQLWLDFLPLGVSPKDGQREILAATVSGKLVKELQQALEAAGLELTSLSITPVATAELLARTVPGDLPEEEADFLIARHGDRVELSVLQQRTLVFTHSLHLEGDNGTPLSTQESDRRLLAEVSRSLISFRKSELARQLGCVWVIGQTEENAEFLSLLSQRVNCQVRCLDPLHSKTGWTALALPGDHTLYAGPLGMLLAQQEKQVEWLDFLSPRKAVVPVDRRKWMLIGGAALLLILIGGIWSFRNQQINNLESDIERLAKRSTELKKILAEEAPVQKVAGALSAWEDSSVNWLEELDRWSQTAAHRREQNLTEVRYTQNTGTVNGKILVRGEADSRRVVEQVSGNLSAISAYQVRPYQLNPAENSVRYELNIDISTPKKKAAKK